MARLLPAIWRVRLKRGLWPPSRPRAARRPCNRSVRAGQRREQLEAAIHRNDDPQAAQLAQVPRARVHIPPRPVGIVPPGRVLAQGDGNEKIVAIGKGETAEEIVAMGIRRMAENNPLDEAYSAHTGAKMLVLQV